MHTLFVLLFHAKRNLKMHLCLYQCFYTTALYIYIYIYIYMFDLVSLHIKHCRLLNTESILYR